MLALLALAFLISLAGAAASGETPGAMLLFALPVWASFLPLALLPRGAALITGAVITGSLIALTILMAFIVTSPTGGDGMAQLAALFVGVATAVLSVIHAGATLARWLIGRGQA